MPIDQYVRQAIGLRPESPKETHKLYLVARRHGISPALFVYRIPVGETLVGVGVVVEVYSGELTLTRTCFNGSKWRRAAQKVEIQSEVH